MLTKRTPVFKTNTAPQLVCSKRDEPGSGYVEGYLSVYGNIDSDGDIMCPGAFSKSIREVVPAGKAPLLVKHFTQGGDVMDAVGLITDAREDSIGLWIHADFCPDAKSQEVRMKADFGIVKNMSVGFFPIRWEEAKREDNSFGYDFKECALMEGTLTLFPANERAAITAAKSHPSDPAQDAPQDTGKTGAEADRLTLAIPADLYADEAVVRDNLLYLERMKSHG